ncbi:MAG: hypothetical protein U0231_18740 [Nitrospiraceae bacterium]
MHGVRIHRVERKDAAIDRFGFGEAADGKEVPSIGADRGPFLPLRRRAVGCKATDEPAASLRSVENRQQVAGR